MALLDVRVWVGRPLGLWNAKRLFSFLFFQLFNLNYQCEICNKSVIVCFYNRYAGYAELISRIRFCREKLRKRWGNNKQKRQTEKPDYIIQTKWQSKIISWLGIYFQKIVCGKWSEKIIMVNMIWEIIYGYFKYLSRISEYVFSLKTRNTNRNGKPRSHPFN